MNTSCDTIFKSLLETCQSFNHNDPSGGYYELTDFTIDEKVVAFRRTPSGKYFDDVGFFLKPQGDSCEVTGKSKSRSLSVIDYGTNYCNLYNVWRKTGHAFSEPVVAEGQCRNLVTDKTTCDTY